MSRWQEQLRCNSIVSPPGQGPTESDEEIFLPSGDDPQVLNGRDEVILNALPPQSAPASSLKAVLNGRLCEVTLLKPLPTPSVRMSLRRMGLLARLVQELLGCIALEGASVLIPRAELPEAASRAGSPLGAILVIAATRNKVVSRKDLPGRAPVAVRFGLINKTLRRIDSLAARIAQFAAQVGHMSPDLALSQSASVKGVRT